ncbi:MAG: AAA family ATPase [Acutalibacteraceae bacterium]
MAVVTVVVSGKGGVGKSTLCAGLGSALCRTGKRVLLVDGDAGLRSLDVLLGITEMLAYDLGDIVQGRCAPQEAVYPTVLPQLFLLPAQQGRPFAPCVMRAVVDSLSTQFDHILIDGPAGLGAGFLSACAPADRAILAATADSVSVRAASAARRTLDEYHLECRLVLTRFREEFFRRAGSFADLDEIIDRVGAQLLGVVPEDDLVAVRAANGRPLSEKGAAAAAFHRISQRMEGRIVPLSVC